MNLRTQLNNIQDFKGMAVFVHKLESEIGTVGGRTFKSKIEETKGELTLNTIIKKMETLTDDVLLKKNLRGVNEAVNEKIKKEFDDYFNDFKKRLENENRSELDTMILTSLSKTLGVEKISRFFGRIGGRILSESLSLSIEQLGV